MRRVFEDRPLYGGSVTWGEDGAEGAAGMEGVAVRGGAAAATHLGNVDIYYTRGPSRQLPSQELGSGAIRSSSTGPGAGTETADVASAGEQQQQQRQRQPAAFQQADGAQVDVSLISLPRAA